MLRKIASAVLLCLPLSCLSAEEPPKLDGWTYLTASDESFDYAKNGSAYVHQGVRYLLIEQMPSSSNSDRSVYYYKLAISDADCRNEMGSIMYYNLQGQYLQRIDYIKGGTSVGSYIAEILCSVENLRVD